MIKDNIQLEFKTIVENIPKIIHALSTISLSKAFVSITSIVDDIYCNF